MRANLADRDDSVGLRFVGSEGVMTMWDDVTVVSKPRARAPGYTIDTFPTTVQEAFLKDYRTRYPDENSSDGLVRTKTFSVPKGYSDDLDHITNFFHAVRSRMPVIENAVFGLRAAGPAILTNLCYYDNTIYGWNPETMRITDKVRL